MSELHNYIPPLDMDRPVTVDHSMVHEEGVFFGLPEEEYHAAFALSASGIKNLRISTLDFWARSPLNPDHHDDETEAKIVGRAYHKRIVEGRDAFDAIYAPEIDPYDYPDAIRTNDELRAAIEKVGAPTAKISGMRKSDLVARLLQYDPEALIWEMLVADHAEKHGGKIMLPAQLMHRIEIAAAMIEKHPQLSKAFTGGMPEVSIFWTDKITGTPCKARLDYLKPRAIVDLKSFENSMGFEVRKAIARAVANYRYHIQTRFYMNAASVGRRLVAEGRVFGDCDPAFLSAYKASAERTFLFVWQQKGIAPLARGMVLGPGNILDIAGMEIDNATHVFARCWEHFGVGPWLDIADIETFDDLEFPSYISE